MLHIDPYVRSTAYFPWCIRNRYRNISYHTRLFAMRKHSAVVQVGEMVRTVPPESLLLLSPGIPYDFQNADDAKRFDLYCCNFDLTQDFREACPFAPPVHEPEFQVENIVDTTAHPLLQKPILLTEVPELCAQVQHIHEIYQAAAPYAEEICAGLLQAAVYQIFRELETKKASVSPGEALARRTLQYIREHFAAPLEENTIAAVMHFHPYYLTRLTRQYCGTTPYQYLRQCRYEHALFLLQHTDLPIGEIATACGYTSQAHFSRVISQMSGSSPTALRKKGNGGTAV